MSEKKKRRGPPSDAAQMAQVESAALPETVEKWEGTGKAVLDAIRERVATGEPIPLSWLASARTFSEWHADYLTATEGHRKP